MISLPLFAFLTGLHLAALQFSYFFLLMLNITSTYITYASIVLSWMAGTLGGLLWKSLGPRTILVAGVASYYLIYALVMGDPLAPTTLPFACLGVAISGLWAGRFFIIMSPLFDRVDRLFFHENNGFLIGIIAVFIGFTTLGIGFLLCTPLIMGLVLAVCWELVSGHAKRFEKDKSEQVQTAPMSLVDSITGGATAGTRRFARLMIIINLLLPVGIMLQAQVSGENYWTLFEGERNVITWFSSVQLLLIAIAAYLNYQLAGLSQQMEPANASGNRWVWLVFTLGFVFLSLDERFEIHQAIREKVFVPGEIAVNIPFLRPGDILLFIYLAVGLAFSYFLWRELRRHRLALSFFCGALALIFVSALMDSLLLEITQSWPFPHFWTSALEEVGEIWSQLLFLLSFLLLLQLRIAELGVANGSRGGMLP